ncbi:MAG: mechanosensitive ion channel family protein [Gammaproteobacteria bacterium]|nr:mechanosensitive ion channel family protein [Gammaproteobacteria bacterium]
MNEVLNSLIEWLYQYKVNIGLSLIVVALHLIVRRIIAPKIDEYVEQGHLKGVVGDRANTTLSLFSFLISVIIILFVWGFDFKGLLTLSASILAITGVAMFASWSVLSNVTAFFLLLTSKSYRRGDFVRVINLDNYIEGYISEINLFNTRLISENREVIIYPNNLLVAFPTIINPKDRFSIVGKISDFNKDVDKEKIE